MHVYRDEEGNHWPLISCELVDSFRGLKPKEFGEDRNSRTGFAGKRCRQAFVIDLQRHSEDYGLLSVFLDTVLASVYELLQYASLLQSCPHCAGGLLYEDGVNVEKQWNKDILKRMKEEWSLVLQMESCTASAGALATLCPQTKHQVYREVQGALESSNYEVTPPVKDILRAWFPQASSSSLVEDVFSSMQDSIKRSSKRETACLPGLQAVAVRSTMQRCPPEPETVKLKAVQLESADYEGNEVRNLRANIWKPESSPNSIWFCRTTVLFVRSTLHDVWKGILPLPCSMITCMLCDHAARKRDSMQLARHESTRS